MTNNGKPAGGWQWERVLHGIVPPLISPLDDAGAPDADAMAAHRETPHMAAFGGKIGGMLAGRPEITRLDHVASLD